MYRHKWPDRSTGTPNPHLTGSSLASRCSSLLLLQQTCAFSNEVSSPQKVLKNFQFEREREYVEQEMWNIQMTISSQLSVPILSPWEPGAEGLSGKQSISNSSYPYLLFHKILKAKSCLKSGSPSRSSQTQFVAWMDQINPSAGVYAWPSCKQHQPDFKHLFALPKTSHVSGFTRYFWRYSILCA